jgi:hypothetical protein
VLQQVPRRILRWGLVEHAHLRRWVGELAGMPAPALGGRVGRPLAWYYARAVGADAETNRRALAELPETLDRVDAMLAEGVLVTDPPSAATLQVLCSVRALEGFADLREHVARHPCAAVARELFPDWPGPVPEFLPREWLPSRA